MCESNAVDRLIIHPAKAMEIVGQAQTVYLRECRCRAQDQNCPPDTWEVCLLFEGSSPDDLREAKPITAAEALAVLNVTAGWRSIYNLFYTHTDQRITELCSCCTCCCHPLKRLKREGNYTEQLRSAYAAVTDTDLCTGCGLCVEDCFFDARWVESGTVHLLDAQCFGCGRCIESCPAGAIRLERREKCRTIRY